MSKFLLVYEEYFFSNKFNFNVHLITFYYFPFLIYEYYGFKMTFSKSHFRMKTNIFIFRIYSNVDSCLLAYSHVGNTE